MQIPAKLEARRVELSGAYDVAARQLVLAEESVTRAKLVRDRALDRIDELNIAIAAIAEMGEALPDASDSAPAEPHPRRRTTSSNGADPAPPSPRRGRRSNDEIRAEILRVVESAGDEGVTRDGLRNTLGISDQTFTKLLTQLLVDGKLKLDQAGRLSSLYVDIEPSPDEADVKEHQADAPNGSSLDQEDLDYFKSMADEISGSERGEMTMAALTADGHSAADVYAAERAGFIEATSEGYRARSAAPKVAPAEVAPRHSWTSVEA